MGNTFTAGANGGPTDSNGNPQNPLDRTFTNRSSPTGNVNVNGWESDMVNGWRWTGDANVHRVGETQSQNFDPRTGQNYKAYAPAVATPAAQAPDPFGGAGDLARQMTARRLMLLRQGLQGQQHSGIAALRRQLAQRGALDSGSLGAGTANIGNHMSDLMARGTQDAAISENGTLLDFLKAKQQRDLDKERQQAGFSQQEYMARLMQQFQKENEPKWWEQLLGLGGQVASTAGGIALGKAIS